MRRTWLLRFLLFAFVTAGVLAPLTVAQECEVIDFNEFNHGDSITSISLFGGSITLAFEADRYPGEIVPVTAYDTELWERGVNPPPNITHNDTQRRIWCNPAENGGQGECEGVMAVIPDEQFAEDGDDTQGGFINITGFTGEFEIRSFAAVDSDSFSTRIILRVGAALDFVGESTGLGNATVETVATTPHVFSGQAQFELLGSGGIDSIEVCRESPRTSCRVTAGGNRDGVFCPTLANGTPDPDFCNVDDTSGEITHTWGGQAGAPPRVDGNWTHAYHDRSTRPQDKFTFHSNNVFWIQCSDPGEECQPARPAPARQIDFSGIGRFTNAHGNFRQAPDGDLCYMVHLEDIGEPGPGGRWPSSENPCTHCPGTAILDPDCTDCTDYYSIEIYSDASRDETTGQCLGQLIWRNGTPSLNCDGSSVFEAPFSPYEGFFTRSGNVQMHPDNNGP